MYKNIDIIPIFFFCSGIIDIKLNIHKKTYSLCAVLKESDEVLSETRIPADSDFIIKQATLAIFCARSLQKEATYD